MIGKPASTGRQILRPDWERRLDRLRGLRRLETPEGRGHGWQRRPRAACPPDQGR